MEVGVKVWVENPIAGTHRHVASAYLTFVAVDSPGRSVPVPKLDPETEDEIRRHEDGGRRRRDGRDLVLGSVPANAWHLLWSPDGRSVAYLRTARRKDDADAGLWVTDFKTAPRQLFHGWASWLVLDSQGDIIVLKGKPDLKGELWTVKWDGSGLSRASQTIPLLYNFDYLHWIAVNQIDVSPDGRHIIFQSQQVLQENIGMIENLN